MTSDIITKNIPSLKVVSIRKEIPYKQLGSFLSSSAISLMVYLKEVDVAMAGRGFSVYHKNSGETLELEVCIPVTKDVAGRGEIHCREIPGGSANTLIVKGTPRGLTHNSGDYSNLRSAHEKLKSSTASSRESREIYLKGPQDTSKAEEYETEVQYVLP